MEQGPARTSRRSSRLFEDAEDLEAGVEDGGDGGFGDGELFFKKDRGKDDLGPLDANVFNALIHMFDLAVAGLLAEENQTAIRKGSLNQIIRIKVCDLPVALCAGWISATIAPESVSDA